MTENEAIEELLYQEDMRGKGIDYQVNNLVIAASVKALREIQQYKAIGTAEECREAMEKQRGKKPLIKSKNKGKIQNVFEKVKAENIEIVVHGTTEKPYYEIKYFDLSDKQYHIGYSSYDLDNVFRWKEEYFEIVNEAADTIETHPQSWRR